MNKAASQPATMNPIVNLLVFGALVEAREPFGRARVSTPRPGDTGPFPLFKRGFNLVFVGATMQGNQVLVAGHLALGTTSIILSQYLATVSENMD